MVNGCGNMRELLKLASAILRPLGIGPLKPRVLRFSEWSSGARTEGFFEIPSSIFRVCSDAVRYTPTTYGVLPSILPYVGSDDVFVDLGCGKGRVVWFVATRCRLKKVIGIEIVPELARIAKRNIAKSKPPTPVQIIEGDAATTDLVEGTVYFLFNPFGEWTLVEVLKNIERSLVAHPRRICILYHVPIWGRVLDNTPWLKPEGGTGTSFRVWRNSCSYFTR